MAKTGVNGPGFGGGDDKRTQRQHIKEDADGAKDATALVRADVARRVLNTVQAVHRREEQLFDPLIGRQRAGGDLKTARYRAAILRLVMTGRNNPGQQPDHRGNRNQYGISAGKPPRFADCRSSVVFILRHHSPRREKESVAGAIWRARTSAPVTGACCNRESVKVSSCWRRAFASRPNRIG